ncbi:Detected protein of confused Function [Hibiscus syriacus]|uniref:Detected protein of confused Function n=1 Tax=Hibiscus syriacus TaxID=106335 RepID=A0A6A2ZKL0_HIBSY|nr:Detected protein of confused Function [Hibiscus syriacus]
MASIELRPVEITVETIEGAVTTAVSPVYERFKNVPDLLLVFLDKKVDEASQRFEDHVPAKAKQARTNGPRRGVHYAVGQYKQLVVVCSAKLWVKLNHSSTFHLMAEKVVPTAANLSGKYNGFVNDMSGKWIVSSNSKPKKDKFMIDTSRKINSVNNRLAVVDINLDSKPGYLETFAIGAAFNGVNSVLAFA